MIKFFKVCGLIFLTYVGIAVTSVCADVGVDSADVIMNRVPPKNPTDHTALNADLLMVIYNGILNGKYHIKPYKIWDTEYSLLLSTAEPFETAASSDTGNTWIFNHGNWTQIGGGGGGGNAFDNIYLAGSVLNNSGVYTDTDLTVPMTSNSSPFPFNCGASADVGVPAWYAFSHDGSHPTGWYNHVNNWIEYDFPYSVLLTSYAITENFSYYSPLGFTLLGSNDKVTWDDIDTETIFNATGFQLFPVVNADSYRYYRLYTNIYYTPYDYAGFSAISFYGYREQYAQVAGSYDMTVSTANIALSALSLTGNIDTSQVNAGTFQEGVQVGVTNFAMDGTPDSTTFARGDGVWAVPTSEAYASTGTEITDALTFYGGDIGGMFDILGTTLTITTRGDTRLKLGFSSMYHTDDYATTVFVTAIVDNIDIGLPSTSVPGGITGNTVVQPNLNTPLSFPPCIFTQILSAGEHNVHLRVWVNAGQTLTFANNVCPLYFLIEEME